MHGMLTAASNYVRSIGGIFTKFYRSASSVGRRVVTESVRKSTLNRPFIFTLRNTQSFSRPAAVMGVL